MDPSLIAFLSTAAFLTSLIMAVFGVAGGLMLISIMANVVPAAALVPVHGAVQLFSIVSRVGFELPKARWRLFLSFFLGAVPGFCIGLVLLSNLNLEWLPILIGIFLLYLTWGPPLRIKGVTGRWEFALIGFFQLSISILVPAGPLTGPALLRQGLDRDEVVITQGMMMGVVQVLKIIAYLFVGFSLLEWWSLILVMGGFAVLGSLAGTKLRHRIPSERFANIFRWLLTGLALRMLWKGFSALEE